MKEVSEETSESTHKVYECRPKPAEKKGKEDRSGDKTEDCKFCARKHARGSNNCPAYGMSCNFCKKRNHFEQACLIKAKTEESVMAADETAYEELLTMDQPKVNRVGRHILVNIMYNKKKLEC